jgi:hypothetical protein
MPDPRVAQVVSMMRETDLLLWDGSRGSGCILKVRMVKGLIDAYEGASIAINGVCLTVLEWPVTDGVVSFGVAPETIKLTNLVRHRLCHHPYGGSDRLALRSFIVGDAAAKPDRRRDWARQGDLKTGDKVNVERSQKSGGRNSGHYVQVTAPACPFEPGTASAVQPR